MFIYNLKINGNKLIKNFFIVLLIIILVICGIIAYKIFGANIKTCKVNDELNYGKTNELSSKNYTNILNEVHNNLSLYEGQSIKFTGFVYRVYDFSEEQFVLGRNMVISSDFQTVVVGFLCHSNLAKNFADNTWIEIEGKITKGNYHGEIPVIEVTKINQTDKPNDEYVYPPDDSYIPTSSIL